MSQAGYGSYIDVIHQVAIIRQSEGSKINLVKNTIWREIQRANTLKMWGE
jgi:hypothetical protein